MSGRTASARTLELDPTKCDGHGFCAEYLPRIVTLDEWGYPIVGDGLRAEVAPAELAEARRAVADCPVLALRLS